MRAFLLAVLLVPGPARAGSALSTHGPGTALEASYDVEIAVHGLFATVQTRQRLLSATTDPVEVVYDFELPGDAAVTGFGIEVPGGAVEPGVIVTDPGAIGEPSTAIGDDLGVLEQTGLGRAPAPDDAGAPATYRYRVYPVADNGVWVTVRWVMPVRLEQGRLVIELPARPGDDLAKTTGTIAFAPVAGLTAPRHVRVDGAEIAVAPKAKRVKWDDGPGRRVVIEAEVEARGTKPVLLADTVALGKGNGAIAAAVIAPNVAGTATTAEDIVFVVDASKSMRRIDRGRVVDAIVSVADAAPATVRMQVIAYDHAATKLLADWRTNDKAGRVAVADTITTLGDGNGSDLVAALGLAATVIDATRRTLIVVVTDGGVDPGLRGAALAIALGDRADAVDVSSLIVVPEDQLAPSHGVRALTELAHRVGGTVRVARVAELEDRAARLSAELADGGAWIDAAITGADGLALPSAIAPGDGATAIGWYHGKAPKLALTIEHAGTAVKVAAAKGGVDAAIALARPGAALDLAGETLDAASPVALTAWGAAARKRGIVSIATTALVVDATTKLGRARRSQIAAGAPFVRLPPAPERDAPIDDATTDAQLAALFPAATGDAGGLDQDSLQNILSIELLARLRGCYQQALPRDPSLRGRVTFDLLLGDGEMIAASATGAIDTVFRDCMVAAAYKVQIPTTADPTLIRARYPVDFTVAADKPFVVLGDADSSEPLDPSILPTVPSAHAPIDTSAADDPLGGIPKD